MKQSPLLEQVREKYAAAARTAAAGQRATCTPGSGNCCDPVSDDLYSLHDTAGLPAKAALASLGCGNPTALAELRPGETVLDLGSGGGLDVLLSARRVGPTGKAYGLDMTEDMLALARENQRQAGLGNVEFLRGQIEAIPLPDHAVDVIISNCVINLSVDKDQALAEAFRVLRPGGRFAVSDVVTRDETAPAATAAAWTACLAGALSEPEYRAKLARAGFIAITVEPTRLFDAAGAAYMSAFIRAQKSTSAR